MMMNGQFRAALEQGEVERDGGVVSPPMHAVMWSTYSANLEALKGPSTTASAPQRLFSDCVIGAKVKNLRTLPALTACTRPTRAE